VNKKILLIVAAVVLIACLGLAAFVAAAALPSLLLTQPAATAGDAFMTALKDGNYTQAYGLCAPALQRQLQSVQALETHIKNGRAQPTQWDFNVRRITNGVGELRGSVTFTGNREGVVLLTLTQVGSDWKILSFNLSPR
jgi:hypothetical protein